MNKHACMGLGHGCASQHRPQCPVAGSGTNISPAFTTRKYVRHLGPRKRSCMHVLGPRKQHASVYENVQTIISWLLPLLKGFYDTHTCTICTYISKQWLEHFSYTETVTCMRVLHKDCSKLKGKYKDVKSVAN